MNASVLGVLQGGEIMWLAVVAVVLYFARKIPQFVKALGQVADSSHSRIALGLRAVEVVGLTAVVVVMICAQAIFGQR